MAYDSEEVQLLRRSVFCITTNPGTFLVDDENSRYFTIPCQTITRDIYNMIPMSRLWAQVKAMYDAGIPYLLDEVTSTELQELNEEHRAKSRLEVWLLDSYHMDTLDGQDNADNWLTFTQILHVAQESMDVRNGEARDILKRLTQTTGTLSTHVKGSVGRWWKLPARRLYNIYT